MNNFLSGIILSNWWITMIQTLIGNNFPWNMSALLNWHIRLRCIQTQVSEIRYEWETSGEKKKKKWTLTFIEDSSKIITYLLINSIGLITNSMKSILLFFFKIRFSDIFKNKTAISISFWTFQFWNGFIVDGIYKELTTHCCKYI